MTKKSIRFVVAGILVSVAVLPYGATAQAAPQRDPEVSLGFLECTENIYRNRQPEPMVSDWCVWRIQTFLNEMKWMRGAAKKSVKGWPTLKLDTIYGPETEKAVEAYQRATRRDGFPGNAGPIDGIVGHKTWASIQSDCVDRWGHDHNFHSEACFVKQ